MGGENRDRLSRRDFLKIGVAAFAALAPPVLVNLGKKAEGENSSRFGKIETDDAVYYPFFERHDRTPNYVEEMKKINHALSVHFLELHLEDSAAKFQNESRPSEILFWGKADAHGDSYGQPLLDAQTLVYFAKQGVSVAFEGIKLPNKYINSTSDWRLKESLTALGIDIGIAIKSIHDSAKKDSEEGNLGNTLAKIGAVLATTWAITPSVTADIAGNLELLPNNTGTNRIIDSLMNINRLVGNLHPEQISIFFRNLVMSRKLQTLAKHYSTKYDRRPNISFLAGFEHGGIKDLLTLGENVTMAGFNLYSSGFLKEVVEANGGVNAFCSTLVIPVKEVLVDKKESKAFVLDQELKEYLETRLK